MDDDTLRKRIEQHGLRLDSIEEARMRRTVRAEVLDEPVEPTLIGRYAVLRRLGAGGMGVVYVARDAELHREVAIKLVRGRATAGEREQQRLLEEARALARIAHPNVVAIYDVGIHDGRVFIAMELVHGETLRVWCTERCATWRDCMAAYLQAGRGLAATHAVGLVHRDFKPDNALVGASGRVQIVDFGLAQGGAPHEATPIELTQSSTVAGTVRYMAPEQLRRRGGDARADQFSFCVALWEALYGEHPFAAIDAVATPQELAELPWPDVRKDAYEPRDEGERDPRGRKSAPSWIRGVLRRGLAFDAEQRFESMDALLAALSDDPARRRRKRIAVALVLAVIPATWGARAWSTARDRAACEDEGATITEVWNASARATIQAAILAPQLSYGAATWERVEPRIDSYAADWAQMRTSTCLAVLDGSRNADLADRGNECLSERRDELAAMIDELGRADVNTIRNAVDSVAQLPSLTPCDDVPVLMKRSAPPDQPEVREEVAELHRELARGRALFASGHEDGALTIAEDVLARTESLDTPALRLHALLSVGMYLERRDTVAAVSRYEEAFDLAVRQADDELAMDALASLTVAYADHLGRPQEARLWSRVADALGARADPEQGIPTAQQLNARGILRHSEGDLVGALEDWRRALAIRERILGPDDTFTLQALSNIGVAQVDLGDLVSATESLQRVVDGRTRRLGPEHPKVANALTQLAAVHGAMGHFVEGRALLERALAIEESALGKDHLQLVQTLHNLGLIQERLGDPAAALVTLERALAIAERTPTPNQLRVGKLWLVVAGARAKLLDVAGALAAAERAKTIIEAAVGPDRPEFALALDELATAHNLAGEFAAARAERRRALDIRESTLGLWHVDTGHAWQHVGDSALLAGDGEAALVACRHALSVALAMEGPQHPNVVFALTGMGLAYRLRGDLDLALESIRNANAIARFALEPTNVQLAESYRDLGEILLERKEFTAALAELSRAWTMLETRPESVRVQADRFLTPLAEAELELGRLEDAELHARAAVEHANTHRQIAHAPAEAEIVLAQVLMAKHPDSEARALLKRACAVDHPATAFGFRRCPASLRTR